MEFWIARSKISSPIGWKGCQKLKKYEIKGNCWTQATSVGRIAPKSVGHISRQLEFLIGKRIYDLGNFEW